MVIRCTMEAPRAVSLPNEPCPCLDNSIQLIIGISFQSLTNHTRSTFRSVRLVRSAPSPLVRRRIVWAERRRNSDGCFGIHGRLWPNGRRDSASSHNNCSRELTNYPQELAKQSARTIVETLTVADRVAVVAFSDIGSVVGSIRGGRGVRGLVRATRQNKDRLLDDINKLQPGGGTSFYSGFDSAFNELEYTIEQESTTGCNVAILFLTDGENTDGRNEDEVIDFVNQRTARLAQKDRQTTVFTFSLGYQADDQVMKRIACSTGGLWQKVDDMSDDLVDAMSSYYQCKFRSCFSTWSMKSRQVSDVPVQCTLLAYRAERMSTSRLG